jgi:type II secretory pathway component PulF
VVFKYMAIVNEGEEYDEMGIVVARDERTAREKLRERGFTEVHLKKLQGFQAFLKGLTADVR